MAQGDDIVSLLGGLVDGLLYCLIQLRSVLTAGNAVDVVAVLILEVGGGGLGDGLGGGDAQQGHPHPVDLQHLVAVQHVGPRRAAVQVVEVAGHIGEVGLPLHDLEDALHTEVELMIAQGGHVIACGVHQLNDGGPVVHGAVGGALDGVARVHQQDVVQGALVAGHLGVGQRALPAFLLAPVNIGVHVVGVQDHDVVRAGHGRPAGSGGRRSQAGGHGQGQQQGAESFLHRGKPPFSWIGRRTSRRRPLHSTNSAGKYKPIWGNKSKKYKGLSKSLPFAGVYQAPG